MATSPLARSYAAQKPPLGAPLDPSHPLAYRLAAFWTQAEGAGGAVTDALRLVTPGTTTAAWAGGAAGSALRYAGSSATLTKFRTSGPILGGQTNLTVAARVVTTASNAASARGVYAERAATGNDILKMDVCHVNWPNKSLFTYRNDGATLLQLPGTTTINDGRPHTLVMTKQGQAMRVYVDGLLDASGTFGSSSDAFTNAGVECWGGGDKGDTGSLFSGDIAWTALWSRALSAAEVMALHAAPYQMFLAGAPRYYSFASGLFLPPPLVIRGGFLGQSFGI